MSLRIILGCLLVVVVASASRISCDSLAEGQHSRRAPPRKPSSSRMSTFNLSRRYLSAKDDQEQFRLCLLEIQSATGKFMREYELSG